MIDLLKDRYKLSLVMAVLFFIGIIASAYEIYRLPHNLMLADGHHPALFNVYLICGFTFLVGAFATWSAFSYKNEVIVYRDKQLDTNGASKTDEDSDRAAISLDGVKESLRKASGEKNITHAALHTICKQLDAGQGAVYMLREKDGKRILELISGYALNIAESTVISFEMGEGLVGQAAAASKTFYIDQIPDGYIKIVSGLGSASPRYLLIVTLKGNDQVIGVMEIASFTALDDRHRKFVEDAAQLIAGKISSK